MTLAIQLALILAALILGLAATAVLVQAVLAAGYRAAPDAVSCKRPSVAILVPAHNEEEGIGKTLACLRAQLNEGDRLLVVADNCTDNTAAVARGHGAEVCERTDPHRRGKGYALDCGVRFLKEDPRRVLIIVDADCIAEPGAIDLLARKAFRLDCPVQALYTMRHPMRDKVNARIAEFAWLLKNYVRPLGFHKAGLPCQLMGTGMAFPWRLISAASLANSHLAEDAKLGLELADGGRAPQFCPGAVVSSYFPTTPRGVNAQQSRWEHGHMNMMFGLVPAAMLRAVRSRNWPLLALSLDLMVPPLSFLTLLAAATFLLAAAFYLMSGIMLPLAMAALPFAALTSAILLTWWKFGRKVIGPADLLLAVIYAAGKIPLYIRFFVKKQVEWVRSERK